jgi:hypothetical protein
MIAFVLLLLLLLPLPLIKRINIECRANQLVFVCYASTRIKMAFLNELVL